MNEQAQALNAEEAMLNYLTAEEGEQEVIEEEDAPAEVVDEESETEEQAEEDETSDEDAEPEEDEEIVWNGEVKKVSKSELKELAQKGFDYTAKTQTLAEERRILAIERQTLQAQAQIQEKALDIVGEVKSIDRQLAAYKNVDWNALAENDPVEYLKHNHAYRELKDVRESKVQEFQSMQAYEQQQAAQFSQERLAHESKKLAERIPEFRDPQKAGAAKAKMVGYLEQRGFNSAEIDTIVDSRMVEVIYDALRYKALNDTKPAVKKRIEAAPKSLKSGSAQNVSSAKNAELVKRLRQTGKEEYAAKLIESML